MSVYNPPTESITEFNTSLFNQPEDTLSQAEANKLYLSKTSNDTSSASLTTFNGQVSVGGTLELVSGAFTNDLAIASPNATYTAYAGATTATSHLFNTYTNANVLKGSFQIGSTNVAVLDSLLFTCRQIRSSATSSTANELFSNILSGAVITMGGTASTNSIRGNTTFTQDVITNSLINLNASTYPLATAQTHLGYILKQTTPTAISIAATSLITTFKTILTCPTQLVKGVWRIDWNVKMENEVSGTITKENSFISTTSADTDTPLALTGAQIITRTAITYPVADITILGSSFVLTLTASTTLYLTIARQYSSGTNKFTGEITATRIG